MAFEIDVGAEAIDRIGCVGGNVTYVDMTNPANAAGVIRSVDLYFGDSYEDPTGVWVGTFYVDLVEEKCKCRDSVFIGNVAKGSKQTKTQDNDGNPLAIQVDKGDFIGVYAATGRVEESTSGYGGLVTPLGLQMTPGDSFDMYLLPFYAVSVHGDGNIIKSPFPSFRPGG